MSKRVDDMGTQAPKKRTVRRHDRLTDALLGTPYRRKDGTLLCDAIVSGPGVLTYRNDAGETWRELVPPETLEDPEYLEGVGRGVLTLLHPDEDVTPDNVQEHGVGDTDGDVCVLAGGFIRARLAVRARKALDAIDAGIEEISPGYDVEIEETAGVHPEYGAYDAIQRRRVLNHLAIVPRGRSGPNVRLRADSAEQVLTTTTPPKDIAMDKDELAALLDELLEKKLTPMREDIAALKKTDAPAEGQPKPPQGEGAASPTPPTPPTTEEKKVDMHALAVERAELLSLAREHQVEVKAEQDNASVRKAVALALAPNARKDADDSYYKALLDLRAAEQPRQDDDLPDPYTPLRGRHQDDDAPTQRPERLTGIQALRKSQGW